MSGKVELILGMIIRMADMVGMVSMVGMEGMVITEVMMIMETMEKIIKATIMGIMGKITRNMTTVHLKKI